MKHENRDILKIESSKLKKVKWKYNIDVSTLDKIREVKRKHPGLIVGLGESQLTRWIDEITGKHYRFIPDLISVEMKSIADYDEANKGFFINGIKFRRLLGTSGGIKKSVVFYINEEIYPEIYRRITNGRNAEKELVPAKLEAYQALVCSGSVPVPDARVIVVKDCITTFREDATIIKAHDSEEPEISDEVWEFEHNNCDGCGMMSPEYARKVNQALHGADEPLSAFTLRYAWTKGVVAAFPFVEFAEEIAGTYTLTDIWGDVRDIRDADIILTESMVKLWDSYPNMESWLDNSRANGYQFAAAKTASLELEREHTTNYQFIQALDFTDEEIKTLCAPTIQHIRDIDGGDVIKSIIYLGGTGLNTESVPRMIENENNRMWEAIALMANQNLIHDPHIRYIIKKRLENEIEEAEIGTLRVKGNYAVIVGDLYALCQSMFGLTVTGLLSAGEIFHAFWIAEGADSVACFRAPMIQENQIAIRKICTSPDALRWFRYCKTIAVFNTWDSTFERLSGADADGDTLYSTDNAIIKGVVPETRCIVCPPAEKPQKKIVTEDDLIAANKIGFGSDVGQVCNKVTSMFDVLARYEKGSEQWEIVHKRIMAGQRYVQDIIDSVKGTIPARMPDYWYNLDSPRMTEENKEICANKLPYFFRHKEAKYGARWNSYVRALNKRSSRKKSLGKCKTIEEMQRVKNKNEEQIAFIADFYNNAPFTTGNSTMNRICRYLESEFAGFKRAGLYRGDPSIYQYGVKVTKMELDGVAALLERYIADVNAFKEYLKSTDDDEWTYQQINDRYEEMNNYFLVKCREIVKSDERLTDALTEVCYSRERSKHFAWRLCGKRMIENVLMKSGNTLTIPIMDKDGDIGYKGIMFRTEELEYYGDFDK